MMMTTTETQPKKPNPITQFYIDRWNAMTPEQQAAERIRLSEKFKARARRKCTQSCAIQDQSQADRVR